MAAEKLDLLKAHKEDYVAPKKPRILDIGPGRYLTLDGQGEPGGDAFQLQIGNLYALAYSLKFASKAAGRDYTVSKLEAIWWPPEGGRDLNEVPRESWCWKVLTRLPDFVSESDLARTVATLQDKGKAPGCEAARIETLEEGTCVQALHVGPYEQEGETLEKMRAKAAEEGLAFRGHHHEIYLSDPRRVEPARLRTLLRHPVE